MRAMICITLEHQSQLTQMLQALAPHGRLSSIQIEHDAAPSPVPDQQTELRLLGIPKVCLQGRPIRLRRARAYELLALLMLRQGSADRDVICDALWPDLPLERARAALHSTVSEIRHQLGGCVLYRQPNYTLDLRNTWRCDLDQFTAWSVPEASIEQLQQAHQLYQGQILEGYEASWLAPYRALAEQRHASVLHRLAIHAEQQGHPLRAQELYRQLVARDALDEPAHVGVMRCCVALQQRGEALAQYHTLRSALDTELGLDIEDGSEAHVLYRQLLGG